MGKWDKLNQEIDLVLDSLTQEDWVKWDSNRVAKSKERRKSLVLKGIIQSTVSFNCEQDWFLAGLNPLPNIIGTYFYASPPEDILTNNSKKWASDITKPIFLCNIAA
jgi:hypothetical protein